MPSKTQPRTNNTKELQRGAKAVRAELEFQQIMSLQFSVLSERQIYRIWKRAEADGCDPTLSKVRGDY
jgi:hypothetical protein